MEEDVAGGCWMLLEFGLACVLVSNGVFDKLIDEIFGTSVNCRGYSRRKTRRVLPGGMVWAYCSRP